MDTPPLPVNAIQASAPAPPPLLLVVDDREENLVAMQALLGDNENWQLRCVDSGEKALRCLLHDDVSLVLLDVQMPGMDGYEVAELMRGNPKTRYTPIIFVSAIARTQELILRGYNTGAVDFILKPFDSTVLLRKVHNLLAYENNRRALQRLTQELERERAYNAAILTNAAEGIVVVGENGLIQYANPAMAQITGVEIEALTGSAFLDLFSAPDTVPETTWLQSPFYQHWQEGRIYRLHEASLETPSKASVPITLSSAPLPHPHQGMAVLVRDISMEHDLRVRLEDLIITDPLTGLLNRRGFYQTLDSALARVKRSGYHLAVIYLDLDGFKHINDSLGHNAGDELLRHVAVQLKAALRPYDALARLGGDEFTVLLDSLESCRDAARVAEKLMKQVSLPCRINDEDFSISASVGIACYPECGEDVESLLRAADMAMYEAKHSGRQRYRFHSPHMTARAHARLELEQRLRQSIEQQQFTLAYQPQYYLDSGKLRGFEALLRWTHGNPDKAGPAQFIPLLEETRLINPLGEWIFHEATSRLAELNQRVGADEVLLSINVSPVQFAQPQLVDLIARNLEKYGLDAAQIEVEVTESVLLQNLDVTRDHLHRLRELGTKIAVDDFGTGYSSLAYLRQFELDTLKIDRLFIANMLGSPRDAAVVNTIIDLGRHLGLEVIAEGVETPEQRQYLLQHQGTIMQGWLVAPALPFEAAMQVPQQLDWEKVPLGQS